MSKTATSTTSEQMRAWVVPHLGSGTASPNEAATPRPTAEDTAAALRHLAEVADARECARQEGYAQGLREGKDAADLAVAQELEKLRQRFNDLTVSLGRNVRESEQLIASEILALSLDLAQAMTRATIDVRPEVVKGIVAACLDEIPGIRDVEVRVHPDDVRLIEGDLPDRLTAASPVTADPTLERGECYVTSPTTVLDGRHRTRWSLLLRGLSTDNAWLANG